MREKVSLGRLASFLRGYCAVQEERHGEMLDLGNVRLLRCIVDLPFGDVWDVLGGCLANDLQCAHAVLQCMGLFIFILPLLFFIWILYIL